MVRDVCSLVPRRKSDWGQWWNPVLTYNLICFLNSISKNTSAKVASSTVSTPEQLSNLRKLKRASLYKFNHRIIKIIIIILFSPTRPMCKSKNFLYGDLRHSGHHTSTLSGWLSQVPSTSATGLNIQRLTRLTQLTKMMWRDHKPQTVNNLTFLSMPYHRIQAGIQHVLKCSVKSRL